MAMARTEAEMKDSLIEWIGTIPTSWEISRLKFIKSDDKYAIVDGPFGSAISTNDYVDEGVPLVRITNLVNGAVVDNSLVYITEEHAASLGRSRFTLNDIIFAKTGGTVGKCAINRLFDYGILSSSCVKISISQKFDCRYYYYFFSTNQFNEALRNSCNGTTRDTINLQPFANLNCPIPPLVEQKTIADYLDRVCAKIDALIAEAKDSIEEYKELKQSVIFEAVTQGLDKNVEIEASKVKWLKGIPKNWTPIRLKYLLTEINKRSDTGMEQPLSVSQVLGVVPSEMISVANPTSSYIGQKIVEPNDIVFNKLKAHLGVFFMSEYEGLVSPDYAVYRTNDKVLPKFLEYLFHTAACISEFKKYITGVAEGLMRLYTSDLFNIYIGLPSIDEQKAIVKYVNENVQLFDSLISEKQSLIEDLEEYKNSLVHEVVTGKRKVV